MEARRRAPGDSPLKAFTLIELLIVVAIIAILAAIAIPNMLEAQVRTKVSRMRADMRAVASAMEAYAIDENRYPPYGNPVDGVTGLGDVDTFLPVSITTPIAYITRHPKDVFPTNDPLDAMHADQLYYKHNYTETYYGVPNDPDGVTARAYLYFNQVRENYKWTIWSHGPDLDDDDGGVVYDPTNGTISSGDLGRFGP